ncbi:2-hydroxyacid dehydrogenase [Pseudotenacibaculum sp. MALMAid0570]|uniref:2-hydroxyacid dehydrogenase n=1 Tax=Pseudotenacibaculum sp. MALMAid0570 TaxID=3143938 RepID=UPI0032E01D32
MRILHLEPYNYSKEKLSSLRKDCFLQEENFKIQEELQLHLKNYQYDVIFTRLGLSLDKQILSLQRELKYVVTPTTGLNHIDLNYCNDNKIKVVSLKGEIEFLTTVKSTAEHTWALLLTLIRNIPVAFQQVKNDIWERHQLMADELDGKTIGIIGYGRLGKIIARYAKAFDMSVLVNDTREIEDEVKEGEKNVSLEVLLRNSDIICLMITYEERNINFLDYSKIQMMKDQVILINTSRGEMVNEDALIQALKSKKISGVATDVLKNDSIWNGKLPIVPEIIKYAKKNDNVIITPHMGGYGKVSIKKTRDFITDKFLNQIEK